MLKRLMNSSEKAVGGRLERACAQFGAHVYAKFRIADVIEIANSGISREQYTFALGAHFDFIVGDARENPLFAVEFDGPTHDDPVQAARDQLKDSLCARAGLPILRCKKAHLEQVHDGWDLLSWLIEVWFLRREADRMHEQGLLPPDEDFDPALILSSPGQKRAFPYWLGREAQLELLRMSEMGLIADGIPRTLYIGKDEHDVLRGFMVFNVRDNLAVRSKIAMRSQAFRADLTEAIRGLLFNQILSEVRRALAQPDYGVPLRDLDSELQTLMRDSRMLLCFGTARAE